LCGIAGFIGQALHPKATYALMTNLALRTQERGKEATGIWGAQGDVDGQIIYHKEPVTATEFVSKPEWKKLKNFNPQILLVHCREPTQSAGSPKNNRNNHPHVSRDCTVALIHNGKVEEYHKHKGKFDSSLKSQCDSEMILRIFEMGEYVPDADFLKKKYPHLDPENAFRVYGIEEIFKKLDKSAFACAVGERHEGTKRSLWMFRNDKRPLHMIDLRAEMGQIFFCSTMSIWREAVEATHEVKNIIPLNHMVVEFPVQYAYAICFDPEAKDEVDEQNKPIEGGWRSGWKVRKYKLTLVRELGEEEEEQIKIPEVSPRPPRQVMIYTKLNENDEIIDHASITSIVQSAGASGHEDVVETPEAVEPLEELEPVTPVVVTKTAGDGQPETGYGYGQSYDGTDTTPSGQRQLTYEPDDPPDTEVSSEPPEKEEGCDLERLATLTTDIGNTLKDIHTDIYNHAMDGNIRPVDFREILDELEQLLADAKSTLYASKKFER